MSRPAYVLLRRDPDDPAGEFATPTVLGVYDAQKDARRAAEMAAGGALVWMDGWLSHEYMVLRTVHHTHAEIRDAWRRWNRERLGIPDA